MENQDLAPENEDVAADAQDTESNEKVGNVSPIVEEKKEEDFKAKYFYLLAEMDNMRKRFERERENSLKFGLENILRDLIEVVDNFERTADMLRADADKKIQNIVVGIDMVRKQFLDTLSKSGLTQVDSIGKEFDPNFHEAMGVEDHASAKENEVTKEYQKGYVLNGRLIRAAKVILAKGLSN
jgi:molecular chaperone GrpE